MPKRLGLTIWLIVLGLALSGLLIVYLAFSAGPDAPPSIRTAAVTGEGSAAWSELDGIHIQAANWDDAITMMGYAQARARSWQMLLWRKAAMAELHEWFGPDALAIDRLILRLRIPQGGREAYSTLDAETRAGLDRLTTGINLALEADDLNRSTPLLLMGIQAASWEPWHSVAVERLHAWIASGSLMQAVSPDNGWHESTSDELNEWIRADEKLRGILGMHGARLNWVMGTDPSQDPASDSSPSNRAFVAARYATGSTGIPLFAETEMDWGAGRFTGLILPGTPVALLARTHADSWALLGSQSLDMAVADVSSINLETDHARIAIGTEEEVLTQQRLGSALLVGSPVRQGQRARRETVSWTGEQFGTDMQTWIQALKGQAPSSALLSNDGLIQSDDGWQVTGSPAATQQSGGATFVTNAAASESPLETFTANALPSAARELLAIERSEAAATGLPALMASVVDSAGVATRHADAIRYLSNWNHTYGLAEPGAGIYERWRTIHAGADSTTFAEESLQQTLDALAREFGSDMSSWRWETVQKRVVVFPGWQDSAPDGGRQEERFLQKYQPVTMRAAGHPQTFVFGPTPVDQPLRVTSAWEGAIGMDLMSDSGMNIELIYRRPAVDFNRFLGTFLTGERPPELRALTRTQTEESSTFLPDVE